MTKLMKAGILTHQYFPIIGELFHFPFSFNINFSHSISLLTGKPLIPSFPNRFQFHLTTILAFSLLPFPPGKNGYHSYGQ